MSVACKIDKDCCGCNACAEVCPKHCIEMKEDKYGFYYPHVDAEKCVECGLCERVCPFPAKSEDLKMPQTAYAAWTKNIEVHKRSSSGAIAYEISRKILETGGVVYGCASEGLKARHIRVDSISGLSKLQGSKYVRSDNLGVYSKVREDIKSGRDVVFIGTPCQVAGLKKFIKGNPDNLLLVDIICHGTPSQKMLEEHVSNVVKKGHANIVSFREGSSYILRVSEDDRTLWEADAWNEPLKDMYFRAFMDGISFRPSCNECSFAKVNRVSDITIGDFWGLEDKDKLDIDKGLGISVAMPVTEKGFGFMESLSPSVTTCERTVKEAVDGNTQLRHPYPETRSTKIFRAAYPTMSFDMSVRFSIADKLAIHHIKNLLRPLKPVLMPIINVVRR